MPVPPTYRWALLGCLLMLALAACAQASSKACVNASPKWNQYHRGRTLDLAVVTIECSPELRYSTIQQAPQTPPAGSPCASQVSAASSDAPVVEVGKVQHWRLTPSDPALQLVLVRVKLENHTATSVIVNVDGDAAELRDFASTVYPPVIVSQRVQETAEPPGREGRSLVFVQGTMELKKDCGVDGWMVFEAPKGTKFREMRWRASDSLSIDF